jgi:aldose 1-epimerase
METQAPTVTTIGPLEDGGPVVEAWTLANDGVEVEVWTYGARLHAVRAPDRDGDVADLVVGPDDLDGYVLDDLPYAGATIGRWANRLRDARVTIDGAVHELEANEGANLLHGGIDGFDRRVWSATDASDDDGPAVTLTLTSPDGDQGFPGTVEATATYQLCAGGRLVMTHTATTDAPTIVGMTNHAHFNLAGTGSIDDHELQVDADRMLPADDQMLPRGVASVVGTRMDFRRPVRLGESIERGMVDHCLVFADDGPHRAVVVDPASGRRLVLSTDLPSLHVYLHAHLGDRDGFALEPEIPPDAPNRPDFGLGRDGVLRPGETFRHTATYTFDTV